MSRQRISSQQVSTMWNLRRAHDPGGVLAHLFHKAAFDVAMFIPDDAVVTVRIEFVTEDES